MHTSRNIRNAGTISIYLLFCNPVKIYEVWSMKYIKIKSCFVFVFVLSGHRQGEAPLSSLPSIEGSNSHHPGRQVPQGSRQVKPSVVSLWWWPGHFRQVPAGAKAAWKRQVSLTKLFSLFLQPKLVNFSVTVNHLSIMTVFPAHAYTVLVL